jgi:hypothetical protein
MRGAQHVALVEEKNYKYKNLVGKLEKKRPLGRPGHRWKDNIKADIRQVEMICTGFIWLRIETSGGIL